MDHSFFDLAAIRAASLAENFTPGIYSKLVWSFASVQKKIPDCLLTSILLKVSTSLKQCAPQSLTNIVWGLAALQQDQLMGRDIVSNVHLEIFQRLGNAHTSKQFSSEDLSKCFWAFGLHHTDAHSEFVGSQQKLMSRVHCNCFEGIFIERIHEFNSQELASICMTFARLDFFSVTMMNKIADIVSSSIQALDSQSLSSILWSFATLRYAHKRLFESVSLVSDSKLGTLSCKDIGDILWAYAVLNLGADLLVQKLVKEIVQKVHVSEEDINPSQMSIIIWALSISNAIDSSVWNTLIQTIDFDNLADTRVEVCQRIYEACLILNARNRGKLHLEIPEYARSACSEARKTLFEKLPISDFHMEVSRILDLMREKHVVGYVSKDEIFYIDIAFPSEKIAMQFEMPEHLTRDNTPLGDILARDDFLRAQGWHLISICFVSWTKDPKTQKKLLEHELVNVRERILTR